MGISLARKQSACPKHLKNAVDHEVEVIVGHEIADLVRQKAEDHWHDVDPVADLMIFEDAPGGAVAVAALVAFTA